MTEAPRGRRRLRPLRSAFIALALLGVSAAWPPAAASDPGGSDAPPAESIRWMDWSEAAFARARQEGKPILLHIDASWSRSSMWAEQKVFSDSQVVQLANERWIAVRVDRNRRPDIDLRYQLAASLVSPGEVGLPLTLFLHEGGELFYGRGSIPVEDRQGRPGMRSILDKSAIAYEKGREALMGTREVVIRAFERERAPARPAQLGPDIVAEAGRALLSGLNREFGGFGAAPRLPTPHALQLAALLYRRGGGNVFLDAMVRTLDGMERGAIHDRIGGGFHRSTSDPAWRIPQFEKLAHFNASLVEAYLTGFQATGRDEYLQVAGGTVDYLLTMLRDPAGCFYFAQAPAASFDEPRGAYYTWSEPDFGAAIPAGLEKVAATLFNIKPEGEILLGPPARSTLYRTMPVEEAAQRLGMDVKAARQAEAAIVAALKRARESRAAPPIDRTIYVDSCAAAAQAMLEASVLLDRPEARNAGLQAVDRMLAAAEGGPLRHRLHPPPDPDVDPVLAMDHIMLARASVAAFEQTGQERYLTAARELVDKAVTLFWDGEAGGFFDVVADPNARGYLSIRRRLPNDTAFPSLNSTASRLLNRIWQHTGESSYRARAEQALANQVSTTRKLDQHDAGLGLAVELHRHPPTRYVIVGREEDDKVAALEAAALKIFDPDRVVLVLRPGKDDDRIRALRVDRPRGAWAAVCSGESCKGPLRDPEALAAAAGVPQPDAPPPFEGN